MTTEQIKTLSQNAPPKSKKWRIFTIGAANAEIQRLEAEVAGLKAKQAAPAPMTIPTTTSVATSPAASVAAPAAQTDAQLWAQHSAIVDPTVKMLHYRRNKAALDFFYAMNKTEIHAAEEAKRIAAAKDRRNR